MQVQRGFAVRRLATRGLKLPCFTGPAAPGSRDAMLPPLPRPAPEHHLEHLEHPAVVQQATQPTERLAAWASPASAR